MTALSPIGNANACWSAADRARPEDLSTQTGDIMSTIKLVSPVDGSIYAERPRSQIIGQCVDGVGTACHKADIRTSQRKCAGCLGANSATGPRNQNSLAGHIHASDPHIVTLV